MIHFQRAVNYLWRHDQYIPPDLLGDLGDIGAVKTVKYYTRVLTKAMRDLYSGQITEDQFIDQHALYVDRQLRRAWNEGMRANGLDPKDMTPEWEQIYQNAVADEYQYIDGLAAEIVQAKAEGRAIDAQIKRAELWANRWNDVYNRALVETGGNILLAWHLGQTEDHCVDCLNYDNQVKTADDWKAEKQPQSRELECGGWRCDCTLSPVKVDNEYPV